MRATAEIRHRTRHGYGVQDFAEALEAWDGRCAYCASAGKLHPSRHHLPPLPVCEKCQDAARQCKATPLVRARIARWLNNCHPGVPMPQPMPPRRVS